MEQSKKQVGNIKLGEFTIGLTELELLQTLQWLEKQKSDKMKEYKVEFGTERWLDYRKSWLNQKYRILDQNGRI